jgi:cellobiose transport system permease protein
VAPRLAARLDGLATPYLMVAPFFALFGVFGLFPLLYTGWVSLHHWNLVEGGGQFAGTANYRTLFADPHFYNALANTIGIFLVATVPQLLCALGIAALLDRRSRRRTGWHAAVLLPNIVPVVAVALIFTQLFGRDYGLVNRALAAVGLGPVDWQANSWSAYLGIAAMVVWRWAGYNALLYLAAMQAVPRELPEAAQLDGASRWRSFWSVTVPAIRPTIVFTVVVSTIGGLQMFTEPQLFDASGVAGTGGNDRQFQTLVMYLYENGFSRFDAGYAAAISWVVFLLCAVLVLAGVAMLRRLVGRP